MASRPTPAVNLGKSTVHRPPGWSAGITEFFLGATVLLALGAIPYMWSADKPTTGLKTGFTVGALLVAALLTYLVVRTARQRVVVDQATLTVSTLRGTRRVLRADVGTALFVPDIPSQNGTGQGLYLLDRQDRKIAFLGQSLWTGKVLDAVLADLGLPPRDRCSIGWYELPERYPDTFRGLGALQKVYVAVSALLGAVGVIGVLVALNKR